MEDDFYSSNESLNLTMADVMSMSSESIDYQLDEAKPDTPISPVSEDSVLSKNKEDLKPTTKLSEEITESNLKEGLPVKLCIQTTSEEDGSNNSLFDDSKLVNKNSSDTCEERFDELFKENTKLPEEEENLDNSKENFLYDDDSSNSSLNLVVDESDMMNKTFDALLDDDMEPEKSESEAIVESIDPPKASDDSSEKKEEDSFSPDDSLDMFDDLNSLSSDDFEGFSLHESFKEMTSPLSVLQSAALKSTTNHPSEVGLTRCSICLLSFVTAYEFYGHMKTKHADIGSACVKPFLCVHCNMKYKNYRTLYGHARIAHPTVRSRKQFISEPTRGQKKRGRPRKIKLPVSTNFETKENERTDTSIDESMKTKSTALQETNLNGIPFIPKVKRPYKKKYPTQNSPLTLESYNKFVKIRKSVRVPKFKTVGKDFISWTEDDPSRLLSRNRFRGAISSKIVGFTQSLNLIPNSEKVIDRYKDVCHEDINLQPIDEDNNFIPSPTDNNINNYVKSIEERLQKKVNLLPKCRKNFSLLAPDHKFFAKNSVEQEIKISVKRHVEGNDSIIEPPNKISRISDSEPQEETELTKDNYLDSQKQNIKEISSVPEYSKDKSVLNVSSISTTNARRSSRTPKQKIDKDFITWTEQCEAPTFYPTDGTFSDYAIAPPMNEVQAEEASESTSLMVPRKQKPMNQYQPPIPNLVIKRVYKKRGRKRKRHRLTARKAIRYIYRQDDSEEDEVTRMESMEDNDIDETNINEETKPVPTDLSTTVHKIVDEQEAKNESKQIENEKTVKDESEVEIRISDNANVQLEEVIVPPIPQKRIEMVYENTERKTDETLSKQEAVEEVRPTVCPYTAIIPEELLNDDFGALGYFVMRNNKLVKIDITPSDIRADSFDNGKTAATSTSKLGATSANVSENSILEKNIKDTSTHDKEISCCAGTSAKTDSVTIIEQLKPFANKSPTGSDMQAVFNNVDAIDVENRSNDDFDASIKCEEWFRPKKNVIDTVDVEDASDEEFDLAKLMSDLKSVSESREALMNNEDCELNFYSPNSNESGSQESEKTVCRDSEVRKPKFPPVLYCKFCTFKTRGTSLLSLHSLEHDSNQEEECRRQSMLMLGDTGNLIHCQLCPYVTDKMSSFSYHMKQHEKLKHLSSRKKLSTIVRSFQCKVCPFKTNRPSSFTKHKLRHELKSNRLKKSSRKTKSHLPALLLLCPFCKVKSISKFELRSHLFSVHQNKCVQGSSSAPSKSKPSLSRNYKNTVTGKSFKSLYCHLCNFCTRSLIEFIKHANSHKTQNIESIGSQPPNSPKLQDDVSIECDNEKLGSTCDDEASSKKEKVSIPKYMSGEVKCIHCNFCCYSKQKLTEHFSEKHNIGVHTCSKCEFEADDIVVFVDHYYDHMKKMTKSCNQCVYRTIYESFYNRHMLRHSSTASVSRTSNSLLNKYKSRVGYNCKDCNFSTIHQNVFKRHVNLKHNSKKIYQCTWKPCEFRTYRENLLMKHINRKHRQEISKTVYTCTHCDFAAKSEKQLAAHTRKHFKTETKKCPYCDFKSSDGSSYSYHIRRHTGEGMVYCKLCNFKTLSKEGFRHHLSDNHPSVDVSEAMKNIDSFTREAKGKIEIEKDIENDKSVDSEEENCNTLSKGAIESIIDREIKSRSDVKSEAGATNIKTIADVIAEKKGIFIPRSIPA